MKEIRNGKRTGRINNEEIKTNGKGKKGNRRTEQREKKKEMK